MAMTQNELQWSGEVVNFWPSQAAIDANRPRIMLVQRTEIGAQTYVHGRVLGTISNADTTRGDPEEQGFTPGGFARVQMAASPTIGMATVRAPGARAYGTVSSHPASGSFLSVGLSSSWATLTSGALSGDSSGVSYNSVTGEVTLSAAGVYALGFSVSQGRVIGITTPTATAAIWTASAATGISGRHRLGVLNDMAAVASSGILRVSDNAVIRLRLLSSGDTTVDVADWSLTATWIAP